MEAAGTPAGSGTEAHPASSMPAVTNAVVRRIAVLDVKFDIMVLSLAVGGNNIFFGSNDRATGAVMSLGKAVCKRLVGPLLRPSSVP